MNETISDFPPQTNESVNWGRILHDILITTHRKLDQFAHFSGDPSNFKAAYLDVMTQMWLEVIFQAESE